MAQYSGFAAAYTDPERVPRSFENGQVALVAPSDWTSGFVAGSYWLLFEGSQDERWSTLASTWTHALQSQKDNTTTHDVGFIMHSSYGNALRLTGDLQQYQSPLMQAAASLSSRFNENVAAIRSWDWGSWQFPVIIDNMMNLELLYEATTRSGDGGFSDVANAHAATTLAHHFRADQSSYHLVDFDPDTGEALLRQTHQGIGDESAWARGQAWGLYGFTTAYRETEDERFLDQAEAIADFFMSHPNLPEDRVPYFDFNAPDDPSVEELRDTSAAAIAASALLELASLSPHALAGDYREFALDTLRSLASPTYSAPAGENGHFILRHAIGNYPAGSEIDVPLNYADYYYLEALLRCRGMAAR